MHSTASPRPLAASLPEPERIRSGCWTGSPWTRPPRTDYCGALAGVRSGRGATAAPSGGGGCRDATARSWPERRSAASQPAGRLAVSRRPGPATPGPATSTSNEHQAVRARRQQADDPASGSRRPSTTPPAGTSPAPTRHGWKSGRSASSPQAGNHRTAARVRTGHSCHWAGTDPTASSAIRPDGMRFRRPQVERFGALPDPALVAAYEHRSPGSGRRRVTASIRARWPE